MLAALKGHEKGNLPRQDTSRSLEVVGNRAPNLHPIDQDFQPVLARFQIDGTNEVNIVLQVRVLAIHREAGKVDSLPGHLTIWRTSPLQQKLHLLAELQVLCVELHLRVVQPL